MNKRFFLLFLIFFTFAGYSQTDFQQIPVSSTSPDLIQRLASGVCAIGLNEEGNNCCTGFRVAESLIMTNFHCLMCSHKLYRAFVANTPPLMEPSEFIYSLAKADPVRQSLALKIVKSKLDFDLDESKFFFPRGDTEMMELLNRYEEGFGKINFRNHTNFVEDLSRFKHQIIKIAKLNINLDYALFEVLDMVNEEGILAVSSAAQLKVKDGELLSIIGHPTYGQFSGKKVYDLSTDCKVKDAHYPSHGVRKSVFSHGCYTTEGSSGSPIVDRASGKIIGLHWGANASEKLQFGIHMSSIFNDF